MKVIFLDVDGVLNSFRNIAAFGRFPWPACLENQKGSAIGPESELDPIAIGMIRTICESEDVQIVLHSTWRKHLDSVEEFAKRHNLPIIGITSPALEKAQGIGLWITESKDPVTHFAIIDDDDIFASKAGMGADNQLWEKMKENHIRTNMLTGFTFMDFVNTFLKFSANDIDEIREKKNRLSKLRAINAVAASTDTRTKEQKTEDEDEQRDLTHELLQIGNWSVTVMLDEMEGHGLDINSTP